MHANVILREYGERGTVLPNALRGDDHLFRVMDLEKGDEALPHLMVGEQAEGVCFNSTIGGENWDIEYFGPNEGSVSARRSEAIAEFRNQLFAEYGELARPLTAAEKVAVLEAELEQLKQNKKGGSNS